MDEKFASVCSWCDVDRIERIVLTATGHQVTSKACEEHAEEYEREILAYRQELKQAS